MRHFLKNQNKYQQRIYIFTFTLMTVFLFTPNYGLAKKKSKSIARPTVASSTTLPTLKPTPLNLAEAKSDIDKIIKSSGIPKDDLGIYISDIYSLNENTRFLPASITKIITAAAVLEKFPPGTKLKTQIWTHGSISEDNGIKTLKGSLILKGGGDPSFVSETMWYLVNAFTREEIKKIDGDIWVDDSLFDSLRFDPSRQKERVDRAYDAPTSAMSFNWNSVNVFVRPSEKAGAPARVFIDPINDYIKLVGKVETTNNKTEVFIDRDESSKFEGDEIKVSGRIGKNSNEVTVFKNITKPDLWAGQNLKSFLQQRGIVVTGKVVNNKLPNNAKLVAEAESKPIEHIVADMNKFSNNYVAEMLTKNLAVSDYILSLNKKKNNQDTTLALTAEPSEKETTNSESINNTNTNSNNNNSNTSLVSEIGGSESFEKGSIEKGMVVIRKYLSKLGISDNEFHLTNPSGLNRENQITPLAMWKVVNQLKTELKYFPEFSSSLPIAGIDGTLKKRMKNTAAERWVRAKTGFLTNVVSLSGYIGRADGQVISFVMMFNGKKDEAHVREIFDKICLRLVE